MGFGFFGKVPQKGDYVAIDLPAKVLHPLEDWMSQAVVTSKLTLGEQWQAAYLVAPIWRFWLPRPVLGLSCAGTLVSSVDSGGRYFPAALLFVADEQYEIAHPHAWDIDDWATKLDQRLLAMLRSDNTQCLSGLTSGLPSPAFAQHTVGQGTWWHGDFHPEMDLQFSSLPPPSTYARMITASTAA